uniref:C-type lectin domain-containing protein n=1 Tax=Xiphophorus couchianus TaxID=32473 RepID=A0A3B5LKA9_9TELE
MSFNLLCKFLKMIYSRDCETHLMFVCRKEDRYTFVNETKTWPVASDYCKALDGNLASFSSSDMDEIFAEFDFPVWIGLRKGGNNQRCNLLRFFSDNSDIVDMKSDFRTLKLQFVAFTKISCEKKKQSNISTPYQCIKQPIRARRRVLALSIILFY